MCVGNAMINRVSYRNTIPLVKARSTPPKCFPRRTSCPGIDAHSSRGSSAGNQREVCGKTCIAQLACTEKTKNRGCRLSKKKKKNRTLKKSSLPTNISQPPTFGLPMSNQHALRRGDVQAGISIRR